MFSREYVKQEQVRDAPAQASVAAPAGAAVSKLVSLFGLSFIAREAGDFLEDGYLSGQQVRLSLHAAANRLHQLSGVSRAHPWCRARSKGTQIGVLTAWKVELAPLR